VIYTIEFQKTGATFNSGEEANADRISGVPAATLEEYETIDASLISQGILESQETYSWDQETQTLTVTRYITNLEEYLAAKDELFPQFFEALIANGWTRTKQMIPA
jgi:hypothetical protein